MAAITIKNMDVTYNKGKSYVIKDMNLEIKDGEFCVFLGPSGCGKSTAMYCIAGLLHPVHGEICFGNEAMNQLDERGKEKKFVPPQERNIAMVFQEYALYPNMTVRKNMSFALETKKAPKELLHKGLDDSAERLRVQLRDTAQQGRRDEYGGDDIEDTAVSGSKRAAAELLKQRKQKATEQPSDPARNSASAPDARRNESPIIRTKDTEFAETQTPAATPQAQARRAAMQKAAAVKTKDTYIETQVKTSVTEAPEPQRQGQRAFVREQGRKAMRQTRLRQTEQNRRLRNTSPGLGTSETISTAQNAEDLSRKSIKERTSIPFPKASQKALLKKDGQAEHSV